MRKTIDAWLVAYMLFEDGIWHWNVALNEKDAKRRLNHHKKYGKKRVRAFIIKSRLPNPDCYK